MIINPVSSDLGIPRLNHPILTAPQDLEALGEIIGNLTEKKTLINDLIIEALIESSDILPGENKFIYVLPYNPQYDVTGEAFNKYTTIIMIDPLFLEDDLKYTVAHEYHHLVAMESEVGNTLLESVILEGKADTFAEMMYPTVDVSWSEPLTGDYEKESWKIFYENLDSDDYEIWEDFYVGNESKGILPWTNYIIGYQIMESFLIENPDVSLEEWTRMPAKDIYTKSNLKSVE